MDDLYERQKRYYHLRAGEYDEGTWDPAAEEHADAVAALVGVVRGLPAARTLDVGCGTAFLTQYLRGDVTALDASADMLAFAAERVPDASLVVGDALRLPFADRAFERVFSSYFYDHLRPAERRAFLAEARRVAGEIVLAQQNGPEHREGTELRPLRDGSEHEIYKVFFTPESLLAELGGGEVLHADDVFVVARRTWP